MPWTLILVCEGESDRSTTDCHAGWGNSIHGNPHPALFLFLVLSLSRSMRCTCVWTTQLTSSVLAWLPMLLANSHPLASPWPRGLDTSSLVHSRADSRSRFDQTLKAGPEPFGQGIMAWMEGVGSGWAQPFGPVDSSPSKGACGQRARVLESSKAHGQEAVLMPLGYLR